MRVWLAGPMTGYELHNFPAFDVTAQRLRKAGWDVISPADLDRSAGLTPSVSGDPLPGDLLKECVIRDMLAVTECGAVALMKGWKKSKGVRVEMATALMLGLEILDAETMEPLSDEEIEGALPWLI